MEAIGIGDLHFDGTLANYMDNHQQAILNEVRKPLEIALQQGIANIFLYGDVSHGPRMSYESQMAFVRIIDKYPQLNFYLILGNHDMFGTDVSAGHSLQLIDLMNRPNLKIFKRPTIRKIGNAKVQFLPFPHDSFKSGMLNVCHVNVAGAKNDNGYPVKSDIKSNAVVVAGHIHTNQQVRNTHYSGTLYQTRMGESVNKGYHHIRYNSDNDYDIEFVPQEPDFKLITLIVDSKQRLQKADPSKGNLYRLIIKDGVDVSPSDWEHLNVVRHNSYKSSTELQSMLNIEHNEGQELQISIPQFLEAYLTSNGEDTDRVQSLLRLRKSIITEATT